MAEIGRCFSADEYHETDIPGCPEHSIHGRVGCGRAVCRPLCISAVSSCATGDKKQGAIRTFRVDRWKGEYRRCIYPSFQGVGAQ